MKRVTMKDIAARAGVAQQSVSEVLNNYPRSRIKPETRQRILDAARDLGYKPNYLASSLKKGRTDAIGFIGAGSGEENSRFTLPNMQAAAGIEDALPEDKSLIMLSGRGNKGLEKSLNLVRRGIVDGLILKVYPFHYPVLEESIIPELDLTGIPYIIIHPTGRDLPCTHVGIDREYGAYLAAKTMLEHGITDIGVSLPGPYQLERDELKDGVTRALEEKGARLADTRVFSGRGHAPGEEFKPEPPRQPLAERMADLPGGLIMNSSGAALRTVQSMEEHGKKVPGDIVIAGVSPLVETEPMAERVLLTGMPLEEQSAAATDLLLKMVNGDPVEPCVLRPRVLQVPAGW